MDIYFIAIGGTGMAPLACLLQEEGHTVRGADGPLYPPMSTLLEEAGIEPLVGYHPDHLRPQPDLVVVGNAVHRHNVEAQAAEQQGIELASMPQALARFFLEGREPLVVAGTHGKTTTSSMAAFSLTRCGAKPGYLIGGAPVDLPASFCRGSGARFVVEGDEYNAAYFDRGPKFLHYRAQTMILTGVEYDHMDLYPTEESFRRAFERLIDQMPADGLVIACADSEGVSELVQRAGCPRLLYSVRPDSKADVRPLTRPVPGLDGVRFVVEDSGAWEILLPVFGEHNVSNALAVWCALRADGIPPDKIAAALSEFRGVKRRLEQIGSAGGKTVVDDFAHHPTEVEKSIEGLRARYPGRRITVLYEPRSLTAGRSVLFDRYLQAFAQADQVSLAPVFHSGRLEPEQLLDIEKLASALQQSGIAATAHPSVDSILGQALAQARAGDVIATMSSGSFENLPQRLLEGLAS